MKKPDAKYKFVCRKCGKVTGEVYLWWQEADHERSSLFGARIPQELCESCYQLEKLTE